MSRLRSSAVLAALCAVLSAGCFNVNHRLPPHAYFGTLPASPGETSTRFERSAMKNWLLAGLFPWSRFSSDNLLAESASGVIRYENLAVETRFSVIDTIIWLVPGQFYGYYVWAPRHVSVSGDEVRNGVARR